MFHTSWVFTWIYRKLLCRAVGFVCEWLCALLDSELCFWGFLWCTQTQRDTWHWCDKPVSRSDTLTEHTKSQSFLHSIIIPLKFQFIFCAKEGQTHCFYATWMLLVSFWKLSQNNAFLPKIYFLTLGLQHYSSVYAGKLNRKSKSKETLINSALHGKSTTDFAKAVGTILCILVWSMPFRALVNSPCRIGNGNTSFIGQAGSSTAWLPDISPQQVWVEKNNP